MRRFLKFAGFAAAIGMQMILFGWFISGLFGKRWYLFWGYLIIAIFYYWGYHNPDIRLNNHWPQRGPMGGREMWEQNHR